MKSNSINLEKKLKLKFVDQKIFIKSLTHKSFDSKNNNEKIEFLGDRVLGLVIAKKLLERRDRTLLLCCDVNVRKAISTLESNTLKNC